MNFMKAVEAKLGKNLLIKKQLEIPSRTRWRINSGSTALNIILGGGLPFGKIIQLKGWEKTLKTTTALNFIKQAQLAGGFGAWIQGENTFEPDWVEGMGIKCDDQALKTGVFVYPEETKYAVKAMDYIEKLLDAYSSEYPDGDGPPFIIVWDSLGASMSFDEYDIALMNIKKDEPTTVTPGNLAREVARGIRRISDKIVGMKASLVYINHKYMNIGVMFGDKTSDRGGKQIRYHNDVSLELSLHRNPPLNKQGKQVKIFLEKSKVSADGKEIIVDYYFGTAKNPEGLDDTSSIWSYLKEKGTLEHVSSGYYKLFPDGKKFNLDSFTAEFLNSGEFRNKIYDLLQTILFESPKLLEKWKFTAPINKDSQPLLVEDNEQNDSQE